MGCMEDVMFICCFSFCRTEEIKCNTLVFVLGLRFLHLMSIVKLRLLGVSHVKC